MIDGSAINLGLGGAAAVAIGCCRLLCVLVTHVSRCAAFAVTAGKHTVDVAAIDGDMGGRHGSCITTAIYILDARFATIDGHCRVIRIVINVVGLVATAVNAVDGVSFVAAAVHYGRIGGIDGDRDRVLGRSIEIVATEDTARVVATFRFHHRTAIDDYRHGTIDVSDNVSGGAINAGLLSQGTAIK